MGNAHIESLDGSFEGKCLNQRVFAKLANTRQVIEDWQ